MKKNIFLFRGEEKFLIYQEISRFKKAFSQKYGPENIFDYKQNIDWNQISNTIFSGGLFVSKKLIFIWGFPKDTNGENKVNDTKIKTFEENFWEKFDQINDDTIIVFVSFSPDKRTKTYKQAQELFTIKNFDKLKDADLKGFIKDIIPNLEDVDYFIKAVGENLFNIYNEATKLKIYSQTKGYDKITNDIIDFVVYSQTDVNTFDILDKIFFDKQSTIKLITTLQKKGFDEFQFMGMLYWGIKIVLQMCDFVSKGEDNPKILTSKLGVHPFVVAKNLKIIPKLLPKFEKIKELYKSLVKIDYCIKTGKIPTEIFWLEIKNLIINFH